jgi:pimeloyl-ACP methyl ester carboxylesterase
VFSQKGGFTMRLNKTTVILTILVMVLVLGIPLKGELSGQKCHNGPSVEDIYAFIRNANSGYDWDTSIVTFMNEGMNVVCTLTVPKRHSLSPVVITLNGFTGNRDDMTIPGTDEAYYQRLSRILAENGLASLRIDFRGSGDSDGEFQMTTFSTQISDTLAAVDFIWRNLRHKVNKRSIGMLGFSQGGLVGACAASRDRRVDSLVLWSTPAHAPHCYQGLLREEGIRQGLALPDGGYDMFGLYVNGQYLGVDIPLGKNFFGDLFLIDGLSELRNFRNPLMYIAGSQDIIVWPQPVIGNTYLHYHKGSKKLVLLDAGHNFLGVDDIGKLDDAIYWSTAWFIKTLR